MGYSRKYWKKKSYLIIHKFWIKIQKLTVFDIVFDSQFEGKDPGVNDWNSLFLCVIFVSKIAYTLHKSFHI